MPDEDTEDTPVQDEIRRENPSNSFKKKSHYGPEKKVHKTEKSDRPKMEPVVSGKVMTRKKSWWSRVHDKLTGDEARNVREYVIYDIAIPALKDLIFDLIRGGAERSIFGEARPSRGNYRDRYRRPSESLRGSRNYRDERREERISPSARRTHDFREILIEDPEEAERIVDTLTALIDEYGSATVGDLYDLVGVTSNFTDNKWGWDSLDQMREARIRHTRDGYLIDLPRTVEIK